MQDGLHFELEREKDVQRLAPGLLERLERVYGVRVKVDLVPKGTLYDRNEPLSFGMKGKPVYLHAPAEPERHIA
jgi:phenylacetate-CoA ligase